MRNSPGRLQFNQERHVGTYAVKIVDGEVDAQAAGDGQQMDHGVGGAADGSESDDGVVERAGAHHRA